jgi:hyperosmotically inducible periplasmic protein
LPLLLSIHVRPKKGTKPKEEKMKGERVVRKWLLAVPILALGLAVPGAVFGSQGMGTTDVSRTQKRMADQVRHELVMLPWYGVFDNLEYQIQGSNTVVLQGQVTRPTLKSGAERVVKDIEGVQKVVNNIEVLPLSPNDDRIRLAVFRALYGHTGLDRYAIRAVPPIHIIVNNGKVTLEGVVANESDKNLANVVANGVPGTFGVTNNLRVEKEVENK